MYHRLPAFALGSCLGLVLRSHQTGAAPTQKKKNLSCTSTLPKYSLQLEAFLHKAFYNDLTERPACFFTSILLTDIYRGVQVQYETSACALPSRRRISLSPFSSKTSDPAMSLMFQHHRNQEGNSCVPSKSGMKTDFPQTGCSWSVRVYVASS